MCLAVPMKLTRLLDDGRRGVVEADGVRLEVGLEMTPAAQLGDYLIIHAGYAIERLDPEEALARLRLFEELPFGRNGSAS